MFFSNLCVYINKLNYSLGNYTVLIGKFKFKRQMGFAVLQIYVPSIAIVSVSWISLWIRRNATPARVGMYHKHAFKTMHSIAVFNNGSFKFTARDGMYEQQRCTNPQQCITVVHEVRHDTLRKCPLTHSVNYKQFVSKRLPNRNFLLGSHMNF